MAGIGRISFYALAFLLFCLSLYVHALPIVYGDKLFQLTYAGMWVGGSHLYTDILPVSPPLIIWLYGLPALLSQFLPLSNIHALLLAGMCLIGFSLYLSLKLMALHPAFSKNRLMEFIILFGFVFVFRTNRHYFLDREHLFLLLIFPYLLRQLPALAKQPLPSWLSNGCGIMAGIGFCMRPQTLVILAGIQLAVILRERSARILLNPENKCIYATGLGYLFITWFLYPEYFDIVIPMALATYSATRDQTPVWDYSSNTVYILAAALFMIRPKLPSPFKQDIYYLMLLCPFFWLFAVTGNNWAYMYYPLSSMALVVAGWALWEFCHQLKCSKPRWPSVIGIAACAITISLRIWIPLGDFREVITHGCFDTVTCDGDEPFVKEVQNGDRKPLSFGTISIDYTRWTHLARYSGAQWATRFGHLWMLPKLLTDDDASLREHQWIIDYMGNALAEDMNKNKPAIMFVEDTDVFYTAFKHVDLAGLLSTVPKFAESWKHYTLLHRIDFCTPGQYAIKCRYDVYKRVD